MNTKNRRRAAIGVVVGLIAAGASVIGPGQVLAQEGGPSPATLVRSAEAVAGPADASAERVPGAIRSQRAGGVTEVATAPDEAVDFETAAGGHLVMGVPGSSDADGVISGRSVVHRDVADGASIVTRPTDDGAQSLIVIDGPQAPRRYRFPISLDGSPARLRRSSAGGIDIYGAGASQPSATVQPPWATDARGRPVPTRYELSGSTIPPALRLFSLGVVRSYDWSSPPGWVGGWRARHRFALSLAPPRDLASVRRGPRAHRRLPVVLPDAHDPVAPSSPLRRSTLRAERSAVVPPRLEGPAEIELAQPLGVDCGVRAPDAVGGRGARRGVSGGADPDDRQSDGDLVRGEVGAQPRRARAALKVGLGRMAADDQGRVGGVVAADVDRARPGRR